MYISIVQVEQMIQKINRSCQKCLHFTIATPNGTRTCPRLRMVAKMARAFGVKVDFLIGEGENASYEKETVERINDIQKMDADTQSVLFNVIDTYIQNFKTKKAFAK